MAVGQASGVAMLAAAQRGVACFAYTPQAIKMAVCGSGGAGKKQVQRMVGTLLGLPEPPTPDHAADALAVAICHGGGGGHRQAVATADEVVAAAAAGAAGRMIAAVRGEVMVRRPDHVVIDAAGVGYRLTVSAETLKAVPAAGSEAFLHAELISRDDSLALYGFSSEEERDLFRQLISVSGVGPKVAIATLSGGSARELLRAIAAGDAKRFQAVPGIGKRTAERIIVELREKVAGALEEEVARRCGRGRRRARRSPATASSTSATRRWRPSSCSTGSRATTRRSWSPRPCARPRRARSGHERLAGHRRRAHPHSRDRRRAGPGRRRGSRPRRPRRRTRRGPRPLAAPADARPTSSTRRR